MVGRARHHGQHPGFSAINEERRHDGGGFNRCWSGYRYERLRSEFEEIVALQEGLRLTQYDQQRVPPLVILELDEDRGKTFSRIQGVLAASPATEIFLTAPQTESEVLLEALRAGGKEFIPQPINRAELEEALARFRERHRERKPETAKRGKLIAFIGSKGSVGTTTIAVNLAISLRASERQQLGSPRRSESAIRRCRPLLGYGARPFDGGCRQKRRAPG